MLKIKRVIVGALEVNCFIVRDSETNDALIIDPGDEADRIIEAVKLVEAKPLGILLTNMMIFASLLDMSRRRCTIDGLASLVLFLRRQGLGWPT